ncbi:MAG: MMPL family transporter [Verrucomicrobiales bacterium]|nr:MMPL family transporter [Verrucomicrobiales bacterium]
MTEAFARRLVQNRLIAWLIFFVVSTIAGIGLSRVSFDDDLRKAFRPRDDKEAKLIDRFPLSDNTFLILVQTREGGDFFEPETVGHLREFDFSLRETEGVERIGTIFDARSQTETEEGYFPPLMPAFDAKPEAFSKARDEALKHPAVRSVLLSPNAKSLLFLVDPLPDRTQARQLGPIVRDIQMHGETLAENAGLKVSVTGMPVLRTYVVNQSKKEQIIFSLGGLVIGTVIGWLVSRRWGTLAITFPVPALASAWSFGALGLYGYAINPMNNMISVLVMIISLTDSVHLIYGIRRHKAAGKSNPDAAAAGLAEVGPACLLTSITTAIAFASLGLSSNNMVAEFGIGCASGTLLAFVAVVTFIPLLASTWLGDHILPKNQSRDLANWTGFTRIAGAVASRPVTVSLAGIAATIAAGLLCTQLDSDYRYRENFDRDTVEWQAIATIDRDFGGSQPLHILIDPIPQENAGSPSEILPVLARVEQELRESGHSGEPFSLITILKGLRKDGQPGAFETLLEDAPEGSLAPLYHRESGASLVTAPLPDLGARALAPAIREIDSRLEKIEADFPGFSVSTAGVTAESILTSRSMISEIGISLFFAATFIFIIIGLALRSKSIGFRCLIPNLFPIAITGAALVVAGKPLQYISAITLTICLGVAVDDTIHFLFAYRKNRNKGLDPVSATRESTRTVGAALITSTAILISGFSLLQVSELPTVRLFSWLGIGTLFAALIADLLVLPALLLLGKKRD